MNRKVYLPVLFFLSLSFMGNAQINKGSVLLGGQIYASSSVDKTGDQKNQQNSNAAFNISVGKTVKENAVAGISLMYSPSVAKYYNNPGSSIAKTKMNQYSAGVYYRLYKNIGKDFYFFGEFGAAYIGSKSSSQDDQGNELSSSRTSGGQLSLTPGLSYKLLKNLHLEILIPNLVDINYSVTKPSPSIAASKQERFSFNSSLNSNGLNALGVGFRIIL